MPPRAGDRREMTAGRSSGKENSDSASRWQHGRATKSERPAPVLPPTANLRPGVLTEADRTAADGSAPAKGRRDEATLQPILGKGAAAAPPNSPPPLFRGCSPNRFRQGSSLLPGGSSR